MLTLRGIYKDGTITFLDEPPVGIECEVQIAFIDATDPLLIIQGKGKEPC